MCVYHSDFESASSSACWSSLAVYGRPPPGASPASLTCVLNVADLTYLEGCIRAQMSAGEWR
jgi:hypothetical protein